MSAPYDFPEISKNQSVAETSCADVVIGAGVAASIWRIVPPQNATLLVKALVSAVDLTTGDAAAYERSACFKRATGVPTQIGATAALITLEDDPAWDCTINIDASVTPNKIAIVATGDAAHQTSWSASVQLVLAHAGSGPDSGVFAFGDRG